MTLRMEAMDSRSTRPLSDDACNGAGRRPGIRRCPDAREERLALEPDAQARVAQWQQQKRLLQGLHRAVLDEAVPSPLLEVRVKPAACASQRIAGGAWAAWPLVSCCCFSVWACLTHTHWQDRQSGTSAFTHSSFQ